MLASQLINLIYPRRCPVCFDIVSGSQLIHPQCQQKLKPVNHPLCLKCGKPLSSDQKEYCHDCLRHPKTYNSGHFLWLYDEYSSKSVLAFKYKAKLEFKTFYTHQLIHHYAHWLQTIAPEIIIPVPLSPKKYRQRGYNQAAVLAKSLSLYTNIPVDTHYLIRNKWTTPQKNLTAQERLKNLQKAFCINPHQKGHNSYNNVLLIDDIYTTGSTIEACSRVLKKAGLEKIYYLALCGGEDS